MNKTRWNQLEETSARGKRSSQRIAKSVFAVAIVAASVLGGVGQAQAVTVTPSTTWSQYGTSGHVYGSAHVQTFNCGILVCSTTNTPSGAVKRTSGTAANEARVSISTTIQTVLGSVSLGTGGVDAGFSLSSSTCEGGWWDGLSGADHVSVSFGSQEICTGNSAVAIWQPTYSVTGGLRVSSSWTARTATS